MHLVFLERDCGEVGWDDHIPFDSVKEGPFPLETMLQTRIL